MCSYWIRGDADHPQLLAAGIDWLQNVHDGNQVAEIQRDHVKKLLEHLAPF